MKNEKVFKSSVVSICSYIILLLFCIGITGILIVFKPSAFNLFIGITLIISIFFVLLALFKYRVYISEDSICVRDLITNGRRGINWAEIGSVTDDHYMFWHIYHIVSIDGAKEKRIAVSNQLKNYVEILNEIIERAEQAQVDDSIRELVETYKGKK